MKTAHEHTVEKQAVYHTCMLTAQSAKSESDENVNSHRGRWRLAQSCFHYTHRH